MRPWTETRPCPRVRRAGPSVPSTSARSSRSTRPQPATARRAPSFDARASTPHTSANGAGPATRVPSPDSRPGRDPGPVARAARAGPPAPPRREGRGRAGQGPPGHRHPGKSIGALGTAAGRERRGRAAAAVIDAAFGELEPLVGTKGACQALGRARASHYRQLEVPGSVRPSHGPARPTRLGPTNAGRCSTSCTRSASWTARQRRSGPPCSTRAPGSPRSPRCIGCCAPTARCASDDEASHPPRAVPELVAEAPARVWSYDATALRGPRRGCWYDLFVMLDIFSRYVPGWLVVEGQERRVVRDWIEAVVAAQAIRAGPAHHPCRPGQGDDREARLAAARGPAHRTHPWAAPCLQRQSLLRGRLQDAQVQPGLPRTLRLAPARPRLRRRLLQHLQPSPPPLGHRLPHPRLGPLRHRRSVREERARCSMPPTRPIPSASSTSHPRRRTCPARPGSTSQKEVEGQSIT